MTCNICDSIFSSKNDFNRHINKTHKTHKPCNKFPENRCEYDDDKLRYRYIILQQGEHIRNICGEITTSRTDIINHMKEIHGSTVCHKFLLKRGTSQSAAEFSLSLKKPPTVNTKF